MRMLIASISAALLMALYVHYGPIINPRPAPVPKPWPDPLYRGIVFLMMELWIAACIYAVLTRKRSSSRNSST